MYSLCRYLRSTEAILRKPVRHSRTKAAEQYLGQGSLNQPPGARLDGSPQVGRVVPGYDEAGCDEFFKGPGKGHRTSSFQTLSGSFTLLIGFIHIFLSFSLTLPRSWAKSTVPPVSLYPRSDCRTCMHVLYTYAPEWQTTARDRVLQIHDLPTKADSNGLEWTIQLAIFSSGHASIYPDVSVTLAAQEANSLQIPVSTTENTEDEKNRKSKSLQEKTPSDRNTNIKYDRCGS